MNKKLPTMARRPSRTSTIVDISSPEFKRDFVDSVTWDMRADKRRRILVVAPTVQACAGLAEMLVGHGYKIQAVTSTDGIRKFRIKAETNVLVIAGMFAEAGMSFDGFDTLYQLSCPATEISMVQQVWRVVRRLRNDVRQRHVRIFVNSKDEDALKNVAWMREMIAFHFEDEPVSYLVSKIDREPRFVANISQPNTPLVIMFDDLHKELGGILVGPCTNGPADKPVMISNMQEFYSTFSMSGEDFPVAAAAFFYMMQRNRPMYVIRTPNEIFKGQPLNPVLQNGSTQISAAIYAVNVAMNNDFLLAPEMRDAVHVIDPVSYEQLEDSNKPRLKLGGKT